MKNWNAIAFYVNLATVPVNVWGAFMARQVGADPVPYLFWATFGTVTAFIFYGLDRKS